MPKHLDETEDDIRAPEDLDGRGRTGAGARRIRFVQLVWSPQPLPPRTRWPLPGVRVPLGRDPGARGIELNDGRSSREHADLVHDRARDTYKLVDRGSRNGTFVDGKQITEAPLENGSIIRVGDSMLVYAEAVIPTGFTIEDDSEDVALARAVAEATADLAAPTDLPILIVGPTGAGKELTAQRIHDRSQRKGPLIAVNCGAFGRDLIGSELFGHTAGAFSGATKARPGLFASAAGGTLFLDEVAELPLDQQPALLRALQEKKVRPLGADHELDVDVRVVAATHQSIPRLVETGAFRQDLYARLAGFEVEQPPLSERREEILRLFRDFTHTKKPLTRDAAEALLLYAWPQNVRELKHAAARSELMASSAEVIDVAALPPQILAPPAPPAEPKADATEPEPPTREALEALLAKHGGNVAKVGRATGKHRQQVYRWLEKYGLDPKAYRSDTDEPE